MSITDYWRLPTVKTARGRFQADPSQLHRARVAHRLTGIFDTVHRVNAHDEQCSTLASSASHLLVDHLVRS